MKFYWTCTHHECARNDYGRHGPFATAEQAQAFGASHEAANPAHRNMGSLTIVQ